MKKNNFEIISKELVSQGEKIVLDIGCGKVKRGNIGLDMYDSNEVDVLADLNQELPIPDNSCDEVKMFHILEHVKDPVRMLEEVRRILKPGGVVEIRVPHFSNITAYQVHHKSYWNSLSLDPLLSNGSKSNESFTLFAPINIYINLVYFKSFQNLITKHKYLYEYYLCKIFPGYEIVFILKK